MTPLAHLLARYLGPRAIGPVLFVIYALVATACLLTIGLPSDRSYYVDAGQ